MAIAAFNLENPVLPPVASIDPVERRELAVNLMEGHFGAMVADQLKAFYAAPVPDFDFDRTTNQAIAIGGEEQNQILRQLVLAADLKAKLHSDKHHHLGMAACFNVIDQAHKGLWRTRSRLFSPSAVRTQRDLYDEMRLARRTPAGEPLPGCYRGILLPARAAVGAVRLEDAPDFELALPDPEAQDLVRAAFLKRPRPKRQLAV